MNEIQKIALEKAVRILKAIEGIEFKIRGHGEEISQWSEDKRRVKQNPGIADYVREFVPATLSNGDFITIPESDKYKQRAIQATASSIINAKYGRGTYVTASTKKGVEILYTGA